MKEIIENLRQLLATLVALTREPYDVEYWLRSMAAYDNIPLPGSNYFFHVFKGSPHARLAAALRALGMGIDEAQRVLVDRTDSAGLERMRLQVNCRLEECQVREWMFRHATDTVNKRSALAEQLRERTIDLVTNYRCLGYIVGHRYNLEVEALIDEVTLFVDRLEVLTQSAAAPGPTVPSRRGSRSSLNVGALPA
jgi:hypothetical protein